MVARDGAIFPNICIKCGQPAERKKKHQIAYTPTGKSIIAALIGGIVGGLYARSESIHFEFEVPVCSSCNKWGKLLKVVDADACSGSFKGAGEAFLMHLEKAPPKTKQGLLGLS